MGAAVSAMQAGMQDLSAHGKDVTDTAAQEAVALSAASLTSTDDHAGGTDTHPGGTDAHFPEILEAAPVEDLANYQDILANGEHFAEDDAQRATSGLRPLFMKFASGTFTSGFGARWGVEHLGVDVAAPIGTPIYAVEDGKVISAGPASGFGMWVRLQHDDGTITVYGHVDTATVSVGQRVMAGDQIATVGNRGFSTGPHCHFEVWLNGSDKVDPLPWLASRGISLGPERD